MDVKLYQHLVESPTGKIMSPEPFQTTLFHFPTLGNSWNLNMTHMTRHIAWMNGTGWKLERVKAFPLQ